jgi:hypothetical protein
MREDSQILLDKWQESVFRDIHIFYWSLCKSETLPTRRSVRRVTIQSIVIFV